MNRERISGIDDIAWQTARAREIHSPPPSNLSFDHSFKNTDHICVSLLLLQGNYLADSETSPYKEGGFPFMTSAPRGEGVKKLADLADKCY